MLAVNPTHLAVELARQTASKSKQQLCGGAEQAADAVPVNVAAQPNGAELSEYERHTLVQAKPFQPLTEGQLPASLPFVLADASSPEFQQCTVQVAGDHTVMDQGQPPDQQQCPAAGEVVSDPTLITHTVEDGTAHDIAAHISTADGAEACNQLASKPLAAEDRSAEDTQTVAPVVGACRGKTRPRRKPLRVLQQPDSSLFGRCSPVPDEHLRWVAPHDPEPSGQQQEAHADADRALPQKAALRMREQLWKEGGLMPFTVLPNWTAPPGACLRSRWLAAESKGIAHSISDQMHQNVVQLRHMVQQANTLPCVTSLEATALPQDTEGMVSSTVSRTVVTTLSFWPATLPVCSQDTSDITGRPLMGIQLQQMSWQRLLAVSGTSHLQLQPETRNHRRKNLLNKDTAVPRLAMTNNAAANTSSDTKDNAVIQPSGPETSVPPNRVQSLDLAQPMHQPDFDHPTLGTPESAVPQLADKEMQKGKHMHKGKVVQKRAVTAARRLSSHASGMSQRTKLQEPGHLEEVRPECLTDPLRTLWNGRHMPEGSRVHVLSKATGNSKHPRPLLVYRLQCGAHKSICNLYRPAHIEHWLLRHRQCSEATKSLTWRDFSFCKPYVKAVMDARKGAGLKVIIEPSELTGPPEDIGAARTSASGAMASLTAVAAAETASSSRQQQQGNAPQRAVDAAATGTPAKLVNDPTTNRPLIPPRRRKRKATPPPRRDHDLALLNLLPPAQTLKRKVPASKRMKTLTSLFSQQPNGPALGYANPAVGNGVAAGEHWVYSNEQQSSACGVAQGGLVPAGDASKWYRGDGGHMLTALGGAPLCPPAWRGPRSARRRRAGPVKLFFGAAQGPRAHLNVMRAPQPANAASSVAAAHSVHDPATLQSSGQMEQKPQAAMDRLSSLQAITSWAASHQDMKTGLAAPVQGAIRSVPGPSSSVAVPSANCSTPSATPVITVSKAHRSVPVTMPNAVIGAKRSVPAAPTVAIQDSNAVLKDMIISRETNTMGTVEKQTDEVACEGVAVSQTQAAQPRDPGLALGTPARLQGTVVPVHTTAQSAAASAAHMDILGQSLALQLQRPQHNTRTVPVSLPYRPATAVPRAIPRVASGLDMYLPPEVDAVCLQSNSTLGLPGVILRSYSNAVNIRASAPAALLSGRPLNPGPVQFPRSADTVTTIGNTYARPIAGSVVGQGAERGATGVPSAYSASLSLLALKSTPGETISLPLLLSSQQMYQPAVTGTGHSGWVTNAASPSAAQLQLSHAVNTVSHVNGILGGMYSSQGLSSSHAATVTVGQSSAVVPAASATPLAAAQMTTAPSYFDQPVEALRRFAQTATVVNGPLRSLAAGEPASMAPGVTAASHVAQPSGNQTVVAEVSGKTTGQ